MIELDLPDDLHEELLRRARTRGQSLSDYIMELLERDVSRPLPEDVFDRVASREPVDLGRPAADIIREERQERDDQVTDCLEGS